MWRASQGAPLRPVRVVAWRSRCQPLWGVFQVFFRGIGLGRHEDSVCPVEDPPLGVRFEDVDGGLFGGDVQVYHDAMASSFMEGWRCGVALRLRS